MRLVVVSDTHNFHPDSWLRPIPDGDVFIHCGDFTMQGKSNEIKSFNNWIGSLSHKYKIIISGNHDRMFEKAPKEARALITNAIYLEDSGVELEGIKFYGTPWQPWFYSWAFNLKTYSELEEKWAMIPDDTDVLITHGPAYGILDYVDHSGMHVGCKALLERIKVVKPKYHFAGHVHQGYGEWSAAEWDPDQPTIYANAAICNEEYHPVNDPMVFDI